MAVTRKPKEEHMLPEDWQQNAAFQQYLNKGGSAAQEVREAPKDVRFTLHIPGALCQELDHIRDALPLKISPHSTQFRGKASTPSRILLK